jgi:ATP-dependent Clp protease ATP-binding subunit ClpA
MGARPLKRYIQNNITNKLSDEILFGKLKSGGIVNVVFNKKLILKFKAIS